MKLNNTKATKGFTLVELLVVISIIVVLAGLAVPTAMKALNRAALVQGINNVKTVKSAMDLFAQDFDGEYPSDDTAEELEDLMDDSVSSGRSDRGLSGGRLERGGGLERGSLGSRRSSGSTKPSNYYFRQLIQLNCLDNEEVFFEKTFKKAFSVKKPNNDGIVDERENVWGYTKNLLQTSSSHIPVVYDTPISTGDNPKFAKKIWEGKAIVARLDNSTKSELIGGSDKVSGMIRKKIDGDTMNIFSPEALEEGVLCPADLKPNRASN